MWGCLADVHVPAALVHALRRAGVKVDTAQDIGLAVTDDEQVATLALAQQQLILTNDTDFLRLSAEASRRQTLFAPVVFWPRHGRRTVKHLVATIAPLVGEPDYMAFCNRVFFV
jgi:predicted nuclease of predicted toxin-antitoxin system